MVNLNENELAVFIAVAQQIQDCTGGQFGYSDEVALPATIERKQLSGYMSQLVQKNLFTVDEEYGQVQVTKDFFDVARHYQVAIGQSFECYQVEGTWATV